ncbi:hypothetical protein Tco_0099134 [Tanacetum coccineum]
MAQLQRQADVHQDELCPPNKQDALMDAYNKIDLDNPLKELTLTLDDLRRIFQLPQATDNNHERLVAAPKFSEMVPLFLNDLGFTLELRSPSNFKTIGLVQQWQTLGKMFARCFTTRVTGHDQPPLFTKLIVGHYMIAYPEILRRVHDKYHILEHNKMVKSIFNSGKNKAEVKIKIPSWMITDEMKLTENYRMYAEVFRVDVPTTQSQPIESTLGTHRITSAPRSPNPDVDEGESSVQRKSTVIRLRIPPRRITEQKRRDDLDAKQNEEKVKEQLIAVEIEKMVEGTKNVENDEVDKTAIKQPVNVNEEEEESAEDDYELKRKVKGKHVEESRNTPSPTPIRSPRIHSTLISLDTEKLQELTETDPKSLFFTPSSSSPKPTLSIYLFGHLKTRFLARKKFNVLAQHLQEVIEEALPNMVDDCVKVLTKTQVPLYVAERLIMKRKQNQANVAKMIADAIQQEHENLRAKITSQINNAITNHIPSQVDSSVRNYMPALNIKFEGLHASKTPCRSSVIRPRDQDDPHDDAHLEGGIVQRGRRHLSMEPMFLENLHLTDTYAIDDDELPAEKVSQELVEEMSETVDEAKIRKVVDEMLTQRFTSGDEHQKEILSLPFPQKPISVVQSCQRDPKAHVLSHVNQDLLYLKKGNSGSEKIMLSLHKFPAVIFPDDDIEERNSRWVNKCVKKFNPYARYSIEHWKNPHAKIFYIKRQKEPGKQIEEVYSNSKIVQVIKTTGELGHEHKFVTEIIAKRENGSIVSITELEYKNLNKNNIEDMYLLCINGKVGDYTETGLLWSLVLEGLKSYNNDVKHGYVTPSLSKEYVEYLQLFKEEIEERLKHHDQMRRWEICGDGAAVGETVGTAVGAILAVHEVRKHVASVSTGLMKVKGEDGELSTDFPDRA